MAAVADPSSFSLMAARGIESRNRRRRVLVLRCAIEWCSMVLSSGYGRRWSLILRGNAGYLYTEKMLTHIHSKEDGEA